MPKIIGEFCKKIIFHREDLSDHFINCPPICLVNKRTSGQESKGRREAPDQRKHRISIILWRPPTSTCLSVLRKESLEQQSPRSEEIILWHPHTHTSLSWRALSNSSQEKGRKPQTEEKQTISITRRHRDSTQQSATSNSDSFQGREEGGSVHPKTRVSISWICPLKCLVHWTYIISAVPMFDQDWIKFWIWYVSLTES